MAIRQSMGAGRARLIRQLLTESALLASVSTAIALLIARWANAALPRFLSIDLEIHFDYWLLAFTVALSIAATALFGLAPALSTSNVDLGAGLRSGAVSRGRRSLTTGKVLIVAQMALSFVLVTGAVLLSRTLWNLLSTDLGFDREHVITVRVDPRAGGWSIGCVVFRGCGRRPFRKAVSPAAASPQAQFLFRATRLSQTRISARWRITWTPVTLPL
jgi:hypothetical protein